MVVRRRRRVNKLLGSRTRGHGDTKNRRGGGTRGGRGLAGSHKHKFTKYYGKFGKEKKRVLGGKEVRAINIDQLMQLMPKLLATGAAHEENGFIVVDGGRAMLDKLLSRGMPGGKIVLRNMRASKKTVEKIEKAGGRVEALEGSGEEGSGETQEEEE